MREARRLGFLQVEERRVSAWRNLPNRLTITSRKWLSWLKMRRREVGANPCLWETETDCEQPVLLAHRPAAGKAEALAQPRHRFKPLDRTPRRVEGLEAAHPRHGPLTRKWSLSIPCCRCLVT